MSMLPVYRPGARTPARPAARSRQHTRRRAMQVHDQPTLSYHAQPTGMTSAGRYAALLAPLPRDIAGLAAVAQGLLIHEHMAHGYGVMLSEADRASVHIRPVEHLLAQIVARDGRPLTIARK